MATIQSFMQLQKRMGMQKKLNQQFRQMENRQMTAIVKVDASAPKAIQKYAAHSGPSAIVKASGNQQSAIQKYQQPPTAIVKADNGMEKRLARIKDNLSEIVDIAPSQLEKSIVKPIKSLDQRKPSAIVKVDDSMEKRLARIKNNVDDIVDATFEVVKPEEKPKDSWFKRFSAGVAKSSGHVEELKKKVFPDIGIKSIQTFFSSTFGAAMDMEKLTAPIQRMIANGSSGKKPVNSQQIAAAFTQQLQQNALETPFAIKDVMAGGIRALQISGGDPKEAMELVKLAENMAALNPEKTLKQAFDALVKAKQKDYSLVKDFGITPPKEMGWKGFKKLAGKTFAGGTEELSQSTSGMWDTITDGFTISLQNAAQSGLDRIKPTLEKIVGWLTKEGGFQRFGDLGAKAFGMIAESISWIMEDGKPVFQFLGNALDWVSKHFDSLKPMIIGVVTAFAAFSAISGVISALTGAITLLSNPIGWIVVAIGLLTAAWTGNWLGIRDAVIAVGEWLMPYIENVIGFVQTVFQNISAYFSDIMPYISKLFSAEWGVISAVFGFYLTTIWSTVKLVFQTIWGIISGFAVNLWNAITTVSSLLGGLIKALLQFVTGDFTNAGKTLQITGGNFLDNLKKFGSDLVGNHVKVATDFVQNLSDAGSSIQQSASQNKEKLMNSITGVWADKPVESAPGDFYAPLRDSAIASVNGKQTAPQRQGFLSADQTASMLGSTSSPAPSVNHTKSVEVATLIGEVHVHNEADEDRFMQKLKRMLEEDLLTEGEGVYGIG